MLRVLVNLHDADFQAPYLVTFNENGSMTGISQPLTGVLPGITGGGTSFGLSPGDSPTTVNAIVPAGETRIPVSAPVEPADGTIESCD